MRASMGHSRPSAKRMGLWTLVILGLAGGLFYYQHRYIAYHLPLIRAGLAAADRQGAALLEQVSVPPGAQPLSPMAKEIHSRSRGMWRDTPAKITWTRSWDIPGDHAGMLEWYRQHLLADGWQVYAQRVPSDLQTLYWKDQWLLTIGHNVSFPTDHPPHARIQLELAWDYWYRLAQTSADNAAK